MNWLIMALAGTTATKAAPGGLAGILTNPMIMMVVVLVLFWVMMIVPQRKQQKQRDAMLKSLKKGDKIITTSGFHGEIVEIDDDDLRIRFDKDVIKTEKSAIARVKG